MSQRFELAVARQDDCERIYYGRLWAQVASGHGADLPKYTLTAANEHLTKILSYVSPRHKLRILDIGCGRGRNAIWLAERGHEVVGLDIALKAIELAKLAGENRGPLEGSVTFLHRSILSPALNIGRFDLILDDGCFHHMRRSVWPLYKRVVTELLNPKGYYALVAFHPASGRIRVWDRKRRDQRWHIEGTHYTQVVAGKDIKALFDNVLTSVCSWEVNLKGGVVWGYHILRKSPDL